MRMLAVFAVLAVTGTPFAGQAGRGKPPATGKTTPPAIIKNVPPVYPEDARAARIQGQVVVEATLNAAGTVSSAKIIRSIPMLDQAALDAVKQWVYQPATRDGKPVAAIMTVTVNFALGAPEASTPAPPASFETLVEGLRFAEAEAMARTSAEHFLLARKLADTAPMAGAEERAKNLASAEAHFKRAVELAPDAKARRDPIIRLQGYYQSDNPARKAEGDAFFKGLIERYPADTTPHLVIASRLYAEKTMDAYVAAIRQVAARFPKDVEVRTLIGSGLRDSVTLNPNMPEAQRRTRLAAARTELDAALALDADSPLALLTKGLVLRDLADLETDPKRKAALEAEVQRLFDRQKAIEARTPK